jgi:hypothetical protein
LQKVKETTDTLTVKLHVYIKKGRYKEDKNKNTKLAVYRPAHEMKQQYQ